MILNYTLSLLFAPLVAAIVLSIVWILRGRDRYPGLVASFILGMFSYLILIAFQYVAMQLGIDNLTNLRRIIFYSFVVMGLGSEIGKFLILRYYSFTKPSFNGPLDSIVYSTMISMGFAFMRNLQYFSFPLYPKPDVDFLYAFTMIPGNLFFAVILGFFVGMGKSRENKFVDSMTGLLGASFFNALYNFCFITQDYRLLLFLSIGAFVIVIMLYYKAFEMNEEYKRIKKE